MPFLRGNWKPVIITVLAIFSTGAFLFLKNNAPQESVIIYKTTQPTPKQRQTDAGNDATHPGHEHNHDHPHDHASHSHTTENASNNRAYDWREDNGLDLPRPEEDLWKHTYTHGDGAESTDNGDKETYPPQDWYNTEDPALYIQYLRAQLIKQFGDIPQVHIFVEWREKRKQGIPIRNAEEYITFLEAQYYLWPSATTLHTLETLRNEKANGVRIIFRSEK